MNKKKVLIIVISAVLACVILAVSLIFGIKGCKNDNKENNSSTLMTREEAMEKGLLSGTLKIKTMNKGYGTKGLRAIIDAYKEENPDAIITEDDIVEEGAIDSIVAQEITLGADSNDVDLYFSSDVDFPSYYLDELDKFGAESLLFDMTDYLNTWTTYDEDTTMRDTIAEDILYTLSINDRNDEVVDITNPENKHIFSIPWAGGGTCGFVYDYKLFEEVGIKVPTTTDEMFAAFDKMLAYNKTHPDKPEIVPVIYPGGNAMEYWTYLTYVWWAQYEGYDRFMEYWTLTENGKLYEPTESAFAQQGQLEAIKITEKIIKTDGYAYKSSEGLNHTSVDKYFIEGAKEGEKKYRFAMTPNGDWFQNEAGTATAKTVPDRFKMMKTPKLSSAAKQQGGINNVKDFAFTLGSRHNVFIPSYSEQLYLALDFLSFYYSKLGATLFSQHSNALLPRNDYSYMEEADKDELSQFIKSELAIIEDKNIKYVCEAKQLSPVRYFGGMPVVPSGMATPEKMMIGENAKTAQQIYDDYIAYFTEKWPTYLKPIGIE